MVDLMKQQKLHPGELKLLPKGRGWLMVEFGADSKKEADDRTRELMMALKRNPVPPQMKRNRPL